MSERMITIEGREFSEDTVKEALKKHCDFEAEKKHIFRPGDVAIHQLSPAYPRIIVSDSRKGVAARDLHGLGFPAAGQDEFEHYGYEFVGRITDYINEDTIRAFREKRIRR